MQQQTRALYATLARCHPCQAAEDKVSRLTGNPGTAPISVIAHAPPLTPLPPLARFIGYTK